MKKALMISFMITGLVLSSALLAEAGYKASGCQKCAMKDQKCKVTKLKKKMTKYWMYKDELKLSDEQLEQIADIKHEAMKKLIRESADVKVIKVDVKTELWQPQIDDGKLNGLIDQKYAAKAKVAKTFVKALADAQRVLTDDQRAKMKDIKTKEYLSKKQICPLTGKTLEAKK